MSHLGRLAAVCLLAFELAAQRQTAPVFGLVTDASNSPIPGARITARSLSTGLARTVTTNDTGYYAITALPAGPYSIAASKEGFSTAGVPELNLQVDQNATANLQLPVGAVSESISVVGEVAAVDTKTATLNTVINNQMMTDLPLNGRVS